MSGPEPLLIERGGYLAVHLAQPVQLDDPLSYPVLIGMLSVALHAPLQPVLASSAGLPDDSDPDVATAPLLIQRDLLDNQADDLLAVRRGGARAVPESWQILHKRQYLLAVIVGDRRRLLATPGFVLLFDLIGPAQPLFPEALERACDQQILGLDGVI